ncbi:MAG: S46 family peptidase [Gemmatimonadota bacterium]|nr:S46 family peptidase [Gemmatimonadota bacterium]
MHNGPAALLILALAACAAPSPPPTPAPTPLQPSGQSTPLRETEAVQFGDTATPEPAVAVPAPMPGLDTVQAGEFDNGKMWTFDAPPTSYLADTYGFSPGEDWYARARLGALRIPNCSASLVSPTGLVMTNHHCARDFVTQVSQEGENLLDDGFYAAALADERPVEDFDADQLIEIVDVSAEIRAVVDAAADPEARSAVQDSVTEAVAARIAEERGGEDAGIEVEVISLYNGGLYSAYVFRRFSRAALVMAPELGLGFFGGEPDNFTYPRYALDFAFFRLLDEDGAPLATPEHFDWSREGVTEGDLVFVIGNPGSTSRLQTVAELEFRRDVEMPALLDFLESRIAVFEDYIEGREDEPGIDDSRNSLFSLLNSRKAFTGMLGGLRDPYVIARRAAAQADFQAAIGSDPALRDTYLPLFAEMADLQVDKADLASEFRAFAALGAPDYESALVLRTLTAFGYLNARQSGASPDEIEELVEEMSGVPNHPAELDEALLTARIADLVGAFGANDPSVNALLQGRTPGALAASVLGGSAMADSAAAVNALANGTLNPALDPAIAFLQGLLQRFFPLQETVFVTIGPREEEIAALLGRARFEVSGTAVPPDATFSLRLADGVVRGFPYNGTVAPAFTTYYGLYDRHYSNPGTEEWALPERWTAPPAGFDLSTPLNFVSTADIIGGNSGSPVVNRDLEIVGLVFDGNIDSLPGDYIYIPDLNRSVAVDARGILEALDAIYGADRIVQELAGGR